MVLRIEHLQTLLAAAEVDRLVDDYLDGTPVNELADRYGVHRATVSAHLTRRHVGRGVRARSRGGGRSGDAPPRRCLDESAFAQSMGVDRKAVRRALGEASAISA